MSLAHEGDTMLKGCSILCFGKDWQESPTSNNHVMTQLARHNTVLWVNSVTMRVPSLGSKRDVSKVFKKIKENFSGLKRIREGLYVYTPLVIPFWKSEYVRRINRLLLRLQIAPVIR